MFCDLHTHSYYSDGTWSPKQLIDEAQRLGLGAIALCDHNTVAGLDAFLTAAADKPLEAVPGIEFSTDYGDTELHILGLYIRPPFYSQIRNMLKDVQNRKEQSNMDLVAALNREGYSISYEKIRASTKDGFVNRAHIGAAMTEAGYTESIQDAFKRFLNPSQGYYVPPRRIDTFDAIRYIKSIGAVAVLAHPFLNLDEADLRSFLPNAIECGLDAMEVLYPKYSKDTTALAGKMALEYGLLPSGGSDFHGDNKPDIRLGTGRGALAVPMEYLEAMKERAAF